MRVRNAIFGAPKLVGVDALLFEFEPGTEVPRALFADGFTNSSGERVLVVRPSKGLRNELSSQHGFHMVSSPGLTTASGRQGQLQIVDFRPIGSGTNVSLQPVGFWLSVWPIARSDGIELTCFFTRNEVDFRRLTTDPNDPSGETILRTNVALGARLKIPHGANVLLLGSSTNANGKVHGALLAPKVLPKK